MMAFPLFSRSVGAPAEPTYRRIVEQARAPALYREFGVPDTLDGRFEMLVLHAILFFRRLRSESDAVRRVGQEVFEVMFRDFDSSLRELGVGDLTVPKRVKTMVQAFYGRGAAYDSALDGGDPRALAAALARNVFPPEAAARATPLAAYVRAAEAALAGVSGAALTSGAPWPAIAPAGSREHRA
jgi:cytochrome b pre-mRNA-processing protein 3